MEVGSFKGKSSCYLAEGARTGRGAHVYAVDPWDLPGNPAGKHGYDDAYGSFVAQVASLGLTDRVTPIRAFSKDAAASWGGPRIGLLFIDGSHVYQDVRDDFEAWSPHLAPGAVVVFDDYDTKPNPGVRRYVEELGGTWDLSTPPLAIRRFD